MCHHSSQIFLELQTDLFYSFRDICQCTVAKATDQMLGERDGPAMVLVVKIEV